MTQLMESLDETNIKVLTHIQKLGPRNLLRVSRATKIPFSTVYSRVNNLERKHGHLWFIAVNHAKLGLARLVVLATATPGFEPLVSKALEIPNYWRLIERCEGVFSHHSVQAIPYGHISSFKSYLDEMRRRRLTQRYVMRRTTEYFAAFPDFKYFEPKTSTWNFDWDAWLTLVTRGDLTNRVEDSEGYQNEADKLDLLILKELSQDARRKFSELSKVAGVTLQSVKYRYDRRLMRRGLLHGFAFNLLPYPPEISDLREVKLDFKDATSMNRFFSNSLDLPFVRGTAKVIGTPSLFVRAYTPPSESPRLFGFLSQLARKGVISAYSTVRLGTQEAKIQSIPYELFDDELGWIFDSEQHMRALRRLAQEATRIRARA